MSDDTPARRRRMFLAVALDDTTTHLLAAHLSMHLPGGLPGRAVPPANWHITLRFLGWAADDQVDRIVHGVASGLATKPFRVRFGGLGAFPKPRKATVVWLAVAHGGDGLAELAAVCEDAVQRAGFTAEERPYHAHLTLSRVRPAEDVGGLIDAFPPFDVRMTVSRITVYESLLRPGGAEYHPVDTIDV